MNSCKKLRLGVAADTIAPFDCNVDIKSPGNESFNATLTCCLPPLFVKYRTDWPSTTACTTSFLETSERKLDQGTEDIFNGFIGRGKKYLEM